MAKGKRGVRFSAHPIIHLFRPAKAASFVPHRRTLELRNRHLCRCERAMRLSELLFKGEFLYVSDQPVKHIRGDLINFIVRNRMQSESWLSESQCLAIG